MELELLRDYFPKGTNGMLLLNGEVICFTIELPWKDNKHTISCIPEGRYPVMVSYTEQFGWHLLVSGVQNREGILMYPANNASAELKGCIAPVTKLLNCGQGSGSRRALKKLMDLIFASEDDSFYLTIKKKEA